MGDGAEVNKETMGVVLCYYIRESADREELIQHSLQNSWSCGAIETVSQSWYWSCHGYYNMLFIKWSQYKTKFWSVQLGKAMVFGLSFGPKFF